MTRRLAGAKSEKVWQQIVIELAQIYGWRLIYHTLVSRGSQAGFPDLVMVRDGRLLFVELKTDTGHISDAQAEWLQALEVIEARVQQLAQLASVEDVGVEVYVWRPADMTIVSEILRRRET